MCFSPEADLVGGLVIGVLGIDAVRHVHRRHDHLAFAALPLLLAAHQLVEAFVWWGLQGRVPAGLGHAATWVYLLFAFEVLPVYVPLAIRSLEPPGRRRALITGFVAAGAAVSVFLLVGMLRGPVTARLGDHHLAYGTHLHAGFLISAVYVVATCGSLVLSGYRRIAVFGAINLVAVAVLAGITIEGFASLWCGWAALTSAAIAWHLRQTGVRRSVADVLV